MRHSALTIVLLAVPALSAETEYPLWDGEPIEEYAKKVGLPPTKTIDLGDGVTMEFVLIPAGTFTMGTPEPDPVDEESYRNKILTGRIVLSVGGGLLLIMLGVVTVQTIRKWQRPQWSLAWFLAMVVASGVGLLGGLHWWSSCQALTDAKTDYAVALARFNSASGVEKPAHQVTIRSPFFLGRFETTQQQYATMLGSRANRCDRKGADLPVTNVSWYEARQFCERLTSILCQRARLPSESEFEYACRAGTVTTHYAGDDEDSIRSVEWVKEGEELAGPFQGGGKEPNAFGLYDMLGNVEEWCEDAWHTDYNGAPTDGTAWEDSEDSPYPDKRVVRGHYWACWPHDFRSAGRTCYRARSSSGSHIGFRVVVEVGNQRPTTSPPLSPPSAPSSEQRLQTAEEQKESEGR